MCILEYFHSKNTYYKVIVLYWWPTSREMLDEVFTDAMRESNAHKDIGLDIHDAKSDLVDVNYSSAKNKLRRFYVWMQISGNRI